MLEIVQKNLNLHFKKFISLHSVVFVFFLIYIWALF